jgi:hypothetical protein
LVINLARSYMAPSGENTGFVSDFGHRLDKKVESLQQQARRALAGRILAELRDKSILKRNFKLQELDNLKVGDTVWLHRSQNRAGYSVTGKLDSKWTGPCSVLELYPRNRLMARLLDLKTGYMHSEG